MLSRTSVRWGFGSTFSCTFTKLVNKRRFLSTSASARGWKNYESKEGHPGLDPWDEVQVQTINSIPPEPPNASRAFRSMTRMPSPLNSCPSHLWTLPRLVFCCWRLCGAVQSGFPLTNNRRRELVTWSIRWLEAPQIHLCSSHSLTTALHVRLWVLSNKAH